MEFLPLILLSGLQVGCVYAMMALSYFVIINATGPWTDSVRGGPKPLLRTTKGVHIVVEHSRVPVNNAVVCFHPVDGRVLFAIPWGVCTYVGTTDTEMDHPELEPRALPEEIEFILRNAARYLQREPTHADILSVYAGQRPLVHKGGTGEKSKAISRKLNARLLFPFAARNR